MYGEPKGTAYTVITSQHSEKETFWNKHQTWKQQTRLIEIVQMMRMSVRECK